MTATLTERIEKLPTARQKKGNVTPTRSIAVEICPPPQ